jgi:hypothetical protein
MAYTFSFVTEIPILLPIDGIKGRITLLRDLQVVIYQVWPNVDLTPITAFCA